MALQIERGTQGAPKVKSTREPTAMEGALLRSTIVRYGGLIKPGESISGEEWVARIKANYVPSFPRDRACENITNLMS